MVQQQQQEEQQLCSDFSEHPSSSSPSPSQQLQRVSYYFKNGDDNGNNPQRTNHYFCSVPAAIALGGESALKEWLYHHAKDEILNALEVEVITTPSTAATTNSDTTYTNTATDKEVENMEDDDSTSRNNQFGGVVEIGKSSAPQPQPHESSSKITVDVNNDVDNDVDDDDALSYSSKKKLQMLDTIAKVQRQFFQCESPCAVFGSLLEALLDLMESEYGFIGEIKYYNDDDIDDNDDDNHPADNNEHHQARMYLQTHAITNIAWDEATRQFYNDNVGRGLRFYNMNTLFGKVLTTKQAVISNCPKTDPRAGGVPPGHPPLNHFLGIPFFNQEDHHNKKKQVMNGMVGIANKPGGYSERDVAFLEPFTVTCSNLIQAYWQKSQNRYLIRTLEDKVKERTQELELANESLAAANRRIVQASQKQLEQFASMSHEIRTPLNCIIGTGSLLLQQYSSDQLSPPSIMVEESVNMIVTSGDLLLSVVNDILDYSKLESGHLDICIAKGSLQDTLANVLQSIEIRAGGKQTLRVSYDRRLPDAIHMDSRRLQQIVFNLLGNAVKFSREGGVIEFTVQLVEKMNHGSRHDRSQSEASITAASSTDPTMGEGVGGDETALTKEYDDRVAVVDNEVPQPEEESPPLSRCPFHKSPPSTEKDFISPTAQTLGRANGDDGNKDDQGLPNSQELPATMACRKGTIIRFEVKDYGAGISNNDFESIFYPFHQTRVGKLENSYGGTGLGLAITRKLVNGLGGTISVDSVEKQWSKFTVDLPFSDPLVDMAALWAEFQYVSVLMVLGDSPNCETVCATKVFQEFRVHARSFYTMSELRAAVLKEDYLKSDRSYVCLVHVDKYDAMAANTLAATAENVTLVTVGKKYIITNENDGTMTTHHIRSLEQMIPCALLTTISRMSKVKRHKKPVIRRSDAVHEGIGKIRVLLAEDNLVNIKVMLSMLNRIGVKHVDVAHNGEEAVEAEASKMYDLILMDMSMPVMDGLCATRLISARQRDSGWPNPKIVFVTAHVSPVFEEECNQAGGSGFLPKPFKVDDIEKCLQHFLKVKEKEYNTQSPYN